MNIASSFDSTVTAKALKATEVLGWYGMLALIGAYFLVSFGIANPEGITFLGLNVSGGVALVVYSFSKKAAQLAILNIFWALIGVVAMVRAVLT